MTRLERQWNGNAGGVVQHAGQRDSRRHGHGADDARYAGGGRPGPAAPDRAGPFGVAQDGGPGPGVIDDPDGADGARAPPVARRRRAPLRGSRTTSGRGAGAERPAEPAIRLLRISEVQARTSLGRSTIYRWSAEGRFPAPIRLAGRVARWIEAEVKEWLQKRIEKSWGADAPGGRQLEREGGRCFYTLKELNERTFVVDLSCLVRRETTATGTWWLALAGPTTRRGPWTLPSSSLAFVPSTTCLASSSWESVSRSWRR